MSTFDADSLLHVNGPVVLHRLLASVGKGPIARKNTRKGFRLWAALLSSAVDREYPAPPRKKPAMRRKHKHWTPARIADDMVRRGYTWTRDATVLEIALMIGLKPKRICGRTWFPNWVFSGYAEGGIARLRELKRSRIKQQAEIARATLEAQSK
jgi:hypothetical protein